MAHEILSIKLREMDDTISRMRTRINIGESSTCDEIEKEIAELKAECATIDSSLSDRLRNSKDGISKKLEGSFSEIKEAAFKAKNELKECYLLEDTDSCVNNELLLAEYELDFAMMAASNALVSALEVTAKQLSQE